MHLSILCPERLLQSWEKGHSLHACNSIISFGSCQIKRSWEHYYQGLVDDDIILILSHICLWYFSTGDTFRAIERYRWSLVMLWCGKNHCFHNKSQRQAWSCSTKAWPDGHAHSLVILHLFCLWTIGLQLPLHLTTQTLWRDRRASSTSPGDSSRNCRRANKEH